MPKPNRAPTTSFKITAIVDNGTLILGGDIVDNAIYVPPGENGEVVIADTADYCLYAAETSSTGAAGGCWGRTADAATNTFELVDAPIHNIVYAVAKTNAASVTYGPVITVKPKG